jgi:RimJ/RimL family protein N-acetyltransferase
MPSLMIHFLMAHKVRPDGSTLFYVGNVAPDTVPNFKEKDITHFRYLSDRSEPLAALALQTPPTDDYAEGVLLHLYTDWRWDILARDEFIKMTNGNWFSDYRKEISLAGVYAYHHTDWAESLWERLEACDVSGYGKIPDVTTEDLGEYIRRNNRWHKENDSESSVFFTPEFVDDFVSKVADEYTQWRIAREIAYYNAMPVTFDAFVDPPDLSDNEISLFCIAKKPAVPEKKYVPSYEFEIRKGGSRIGEINLRIGYTDGLYYGGQIGYGVDAPQRGHGYAAKACRLLAPVMRSHGMKKVIISNNHTNIASKRTCEKLGAKLIRMAPIPEWHDLYKLGQRFENIFEWDVG